MPIGSCPSGGPAKPIAPPSAPPPRYQPVTQSAAQTMADQKKMRGVGKNDTNTGVHFRLS